MNNMVILSHSSLFISSEGIETMMDLNIHLDGITLTPEAV